MFFPFLIRYEKRPIHYSLMLYKILQIYKIQNKLEKMQGKITKNRTKKNENVWKNQEFQKLWSQVILKIEDMNPDSLNKVLSGLNFFKSRSKEFNNIFEKIINWVKTPNFFFFKILFLSLTKKIMLIFLIETNQLNYIFIYQNFIF